MDLVEAMLDRFSVDLVAVLYDHPHAKTCNYKPWINEHGVVFCRTCEATVGSINDVSDSFCQRCDCPINSHLYTTGRCLECGKECRLSL